MPTVFKTCPKCRKQIGTLYNSCPNCDYEFVSTKTIKITNKPAKKQPEYNTVELSTKFQGIIDELAGLIATQIKERLRNII